MKILLVNSFYAPDIGGGAEITLRNIAEGLAGRGHDVHVFTTGREDTTERIGNVSVRRVRARNIYWNFSRDLPPKAIRSAWHVLDVQNVWMSRLLKAYLHEVKPDVMECHNLAGISIAAWTQAHAAGIPFVQVLHDLYLACPPTSMFKNGQACDAQCTGCRTLRTPHRTVSRHAAQLVGVSEFIVRRITCSGLFSGVPSSVIYNQKRRPELPSSRRTSSGSVTFGYIGSLTPAKGLDHLISEWPTDDPSLRLVVAGMGDERYVASLKQRAAGSNIEFIGHTSPSQFFQLVDAAIVPSIWPDTLPGVAIEACSYGVPVIASDRGGLPEIIREGINGILFSPEIGGALKAAILRLKDESCRRHLAGNAAQSVEHFHRYDEMIDAYEAMLTDVVKRSAK